MSEIKLLFREYAKSHTNNTNVLIHKACVPLIFWSVVGLLLSFPWPWIALAIAGGALIYYFTLDFKAGFFMSVVMIIVFGTHFYLLSHLSWSSFFLLNLGVFGVCWVMQFIGHHIEGKRPSFLQDLRFLLIGPLWVAKNLLY